MTEHIAVVRGARGRGPRSRQVKEAKRAASVIAAERRARRSYEAAARELVRGGKASADILDFRGRRPAPTTTAERRSAA